MKILNNDKKSVHTFIEFEFQMVLQKGFPIKMCNIMWWRIVFYMCSTVSCQILGSVEILGHSLKDALKKITKSETSWG